MGNKGDKLTDISTSTALGLVKKLSLIGEITSKKMFGGHGIFHKTKMFGMVDSKGKIFLKTDNSIKHHYEQIDASKHSRMPYYEVPESILNNQDELKLWAERSISILK
ncbi:MAG: TfoX/Sxy family protein [Flavobacteriaceae bacterium]